MMLHVFMGAIAWAIIVKAERRRPSVFTKGSSPVKTRLESLYLKHRPVGSCSWDTFDNLEEDVR